MRPGRSSSSRRSPRGSASLLVRGRGEWRSLVIALGATAAIAAVSYVTIPDAWPRWFEVIVANASKGGTWASVPLPLWVRLPAAVVLVVWGARTDRRWTVPVASMLALPALSYGGISMLLAGIPLLERRGEPGSAVAPVPRP